MASHPPLHPDDVTIGLPGGGFIRGKGRYLFDLVCVLSAVGVGYVAVMVQSHANEAKEKSGAVASAVRESNAQMSAVIERSNRELLEAVRELAAEQRKTTRSQLKTNCLLTIPPTQREDSSRVCDRIIDGR